jgi:cysteinyl-tRNA synthetase
LRNYQLRLKTAKFEEGLNSVLVERTVAATKAFDEALDDDLNTAEALAAAFEYVRDTNTAMDHYEFLTGNTEAAQAFLKRFDSVFDVLQPSTVGVQLSSASVSDIKFDIRVFTPESRIEELIAERTAAKKSRDFARADQIRKDLAAQGVILEDTKDGVRWKRQQLAPQLP